MVWGKENSLACLWFFRRTCSACGEASLGVNPCKIKKVRAKVTDMSSSASALLARRVLAVSCSDWNFEKQQHRDGGREENTAWNRHPMAGLHRQSTSAESDEERRVGLTDRSTLSPGRHAASMAKTSCFECSSLPFFSTPHVRATEPKTTQLQRGLSAQIHLIISALLFLIQ